MSNCPWCGTSITFLSKKKVYYCQNCDRSLPRGYNPDGEPNQTEGYEKGFKTATLLFIAFSAFFVVYGLLLITFPSDTEADTGHIYSTIIFSFFLILSVWLYLEAKYVSITVNEIGISKHRIRGDDLFIQFDEIKKVSFNGAAGWFVLKTTKGTMRVVPFVVGYRFYKGIIDKVPDNKLSRTAKMYIQKMDVPLDIGPGFG